MLHRMLGQASVELGQIELFAVVAGPGSFTGLRVGLAAVKGWAEVLGRPIAAVSGLEAVAAQAQGEAHLLAAAIDARGGQIFGGIFRREGADGRLVARAEEVVLGAEEYFQWVAGVTGGEKPVVCDYFAGCSEGRAGAFAVCGGDAGGCVLANWRRRSDGWGWRATAAARW